MSKKHEPELISLPCPVKHCMWNGTVMLDPAWEAKESYKRQLMQRTLNDLLAGHQDGKHNHAQCCHCCHQCPCELYACRELARKETS